MNAQRLGTYEVASNPEADPLEGAPPDALIGCAVEISADEGTALPLDLCSKCSDECSRDTRLSC